MPEDAHPATEVPRAVPEPDLKRQILAQLAAAPVKTGSWWPAWQEWLARHSNAEQQPAREVSGAEDTAGRYVYE
jgi:poly(3-hydroxyalkanoate) synthetase